MSGLGAWVFVAVAVLILNRVLRGAPGRGGTGGGARGRAGPRPSGRPPRDLEGVSGARAGRPAADRQEAVLDFLRTVDDVLASRAGGAATAGDQAREGAAAAPGSAATPGLESARGHRLEAEVGARPASGASRDQAAGPSGPPGASRRPAAGLPALPGRSRLQRAVLYAEVLGPPVTMKGGPRGPWS